MSGRFGLRATPGGFGTPAFGPDPEVVRVSGTWLVHEVGGAATRMAMPGACLRDLSRFVGADLAAPFSVGDGGPDIGDADAPLDIDGDEANAMAEWFALGWRVLDEVVGATAAATEAATIQLWPEHFDAATTVGLGASEKVNLGFSPGDGFEPEPYVYVGPFSRPLPGDRSFWNADFGALRRASEIHATPDATAACIEFLVAGLRNVSDG